MNKRKVKLLTNMAGANSVRNVGEVYEVTEAEAARLIAKGFAVSAEEPKAKSKSQAEGV